MNSKKYISAAIGMAALVSLAVAIPAFAQTSNTPNPQGQPNSWQGQGGPGGMAGQGNGRFGGMHGGPGMGMRPAVFGTVSTINGTTLTVSGKQGFGSTSPTVTFTVDASNATVKKNNATSTVSSIAVGDMIAVQGTVSGTNVTATSIRDGVMMGGPRGAGGAGYPGRMGSSTPMTSPITGNGQPVIAGTISAINGTSLTVTNKSNVTYTVDASSAKVVQGQNTITVSNFAVGNSVLIQGTVNGTSVTASSVIDQTPPANSANSTTKPHTSFFGGIGQFFMHIFGF